MTRVGASVEVRREITLTETKPGLDWINGRAVAKMSRARKHGRLQLSFGHYLSVWAKGRGNVSSEWRFRVTPPGKRTRPLIPDVAYMSYERLRPLSAADRDLPTVAPVPLREMFDDLDIPEA